ncbi:MAG: hypothetical protein HYV95_07450 [Opitutae bacterium]|nr:hypothetical protein [Opitutae bacterium]
MDIWGRNIGPVEYYRGLAIVCFLLPYGWRIPTYWPIAIVLSALWLFMLNRLLKTNEQMLRVSAQMTDLQRLKFFVIAAGSIFGHAVLIRVL